MREFLLKYLTEKGYTQKVDNKVMIDLEDIVGLLQEDYTIRSKVANDYERENHICDMADEIEYRNQAYRDFCEEEDKIPNIEEMIIVNKEEMQKLVDIYEDYLGDDESWHCCLNTALNDFLKQRKGNK